MSFPMVPIFEIVGSSDNPYPGTFCLPQVPLPVNVTVNIGDLATIQVVETAIHGGALYNCVDITFTLPEDVPQINSLNCFNSTDISFKDPFAVASSTTSSSNPSGTLLGYSSGTLCPPCSVFTTVATCIPTACPKSNGDAGAMEGLGVGFPLGVLALGALAL